MATSDHHLGPRAPGVGYGIGQRGREHLRPVVRWAEINHDPQSKSVSQQVWLAANLKLFSIKN